MVGQELIVVSARRWAGLLDDGTVVFVTATNSRSKPSSAEPSTGPSANRRMMRGVSSEVSGGGYVVAEPFFFDHVVGAVFAHLEQGLVDRFA